MKIPGLSRAGRAILIILALVVVAGVALIAQRTQTLDPRFVAKAEGPSGLRWVGGDSESPFMHPGLSCIGCHSRGEGPRFSVAATVYTNYDEKDDWFGVEGVTVQVTDSGGRVAKLVTNKAGNFFAGRGVALTAPFRILVLRNGKEGRMGSPAPMGDCAACHTARGENGAPGRIIAP
jgi:hypothetical protein